MVAVGLSPTLNNMGGPCTVPKASLNTLTLQKQPPRSRGPWRHLRPLVPLGQPQALQGVLQPLRILRDLWGTSRGTPKTRGKRCGPG